MNVILNKISDTDNYLIRTSNFSIEQYYNLRDLYFYIPKDFERANDLYVFIGEEKLKLSEPLIENINQYNVYKLICDHALHLIKGTYLIQIKEPVLPLEEENYLSLTTNDLKINLNEVIVTEKDINLLQNKVVNGFSQQSQLIDEDSPLEVKDRTIITKDFNKTILQGDHDSKLISFKMKRFLDGADIREKGIITYYEDEENKTEIKQKEDYLKEIKIIYRSENNRLDSDFYESPAINIVEEEEFIIFSWKLSKIATQFSGKLSFAIEVVEKYQADQELNNLQTEKGLYTWQTLFSTITITENPAYLNRRNIEDSSNSPAWYTQLEVDLKNYIDTILLIENFSKEE